MKSRTDCAASYKLNVKSGRAESTGLHGMRRHGIQSLLPTQLRLPQRQPLTDHDHSGMVREWNRRIAHGEPTATAHARS